MRTYLWTAALVFLSAATAVAQLVPQQPNAGGETPPEVPAQGGGAAAGAGVAKREAGGAAPNAMFSAIDADGDGVITKIELKKAIVALRTLDSDGDGSITLAEASAGAATPGAGGLVGAGANPMVDQMLQYDRNGDGKLTQDEVPPQAAQLLGHADQNKDGALDRNELAIAARTMNQMQNNQNGFAGGRAGRGGGGATSPAGRLMQYDQNGDGKLSLQEIPQNMQGNFQPQDDLNGDGTLDAREVQAVVARMGGRARAINPGNNGRPGRSFEDNARRREAQPNQ